jgi:hypothetical protein
MSRDNVKSGFPAILCRAFGILTSVISLAGMLLDSRPSEPNRALQMETQYASPTSRHCSTPT